MSDDLFPETRPTWAETPKAEKLSPDRARTLRNKVLIARGVHPFGSPLRQPPGETCGSCAHLRVKEYAGKYFKCAKKRDSNGPATDARKSWPACVSWEAA